MVRQFLKVMMIISVLALCLSYDTLAQSLPRKGHAEDEIDWNLGLDSCSAVNTAAKTTVFVRWDLLSTAANPLFRVTVVESKADSRISWQYVFRELRISSEFAVRGSLYRIKGLVSSNNSRKISRSLPANMSSGCGMSKSGITVDKLQEDVWGNEKDILVVSEAPIMTAVLDDGACSIGIRLVSLSRNDEKNYLANLQWRSGQGGGVAFHDCVNKENVAVGHTFSLGVGDVANFSKDSRFVVKAIFPKNDYHNDWVILQPIFGSEEDERDIH